MYFYLMICLVIFEVSTAKVYLFYQGNWETILHLNWMSFRFASKVRKNNSNYQDSMEFYLDL